MTTDNITILSKKEYFLLKDLLKKKYAKMYQDELCKFSFEGQNDITDLIDSNTTTDFRPSPVLPSNKGILREDPITRRYRVYKSQNVYLRNAWYKLQYSFFKDYCKSINYTDKVKWSMFTKLINEYWVGLTEYEIESIINQKINNIDWSDFMKKIIC